MECPGCHGEKEARLLIPIKAIPCPRCFGLGAVPEEQREWIKAGKKMREDRMKRGHTLREEAKRRKMDSVFLSSMERGMILPLPPETKK
jgi:hypothetical protein